MVPPLPSPERNIQVVEQELNEPLAIEPSRIQDTDQQGSDTDQPNLVEIGNEEIIQEQVIEEIPQPADSNPPNMISVGPVNSNSMDPHLLEDLGLVLNVMIHYW